MSAALEEGRRELAVLREERDRLQVDLAREREKAENLQSVLQDFQSGVSFLLLLLLLLFSVFIIAIAKDHELRQAVEEREARLLQATQSLAEFKHRALTAEVPIHPSIHPLTDRSNPTFSSN